jgi:hypothetical protein
VTETRPAFYALRPGGWRDYVTLLHPPYTLWHLSYVAIGAAIAPHFDAGIMGLTLLAFFLAMGIGAHALDELVGRPLQTRISTRVLIVLAVTSIAAAAAIGVVVAVQRNLWLLTFVAVGSVLVVAYNLELFGGRFHTDFWFAAAWGAFPALTGFWVMALGVHSLGEAVAGVAVTAACFGLSVAQRRLSTPVRELRRRTVSVTGKQVLADGTERELTPARLAAPLDGALRVLSASVVLLAVAAVAIRL